ncbi:T9SS type A sorting domain-containing protein [Aquimarina agarivorans]|uniref:T9SS type A sorting domain-containing protein n=1 Tax=Aquimarina agarivorans TaxID=980584 RepID=UPI000248EAC2|nr:T9SS type A sorting domain-containing protein [Aquimarina agarivorans]
MKIIFYIAFVLSFIQAQSQTMLTKIYIEDQVSASSKIIEGKVLEKRCYRDAQTHHIYTANIIEVYKDFYNSSTSELITIITKGGTLGFEMEMVTPSLQLSVGDTGTFFLQDTEMKLDGLEANRAVFKVFSGLQGFYKYDRALNSVKNPFYTFSSIDNNFYTTLVSLTNKKPKVLKTLNKTAQKKLSSVAITSFNPTMVRAGIGQTVQINGTDFGTRIGAVAFENADLGGGLSNFKNVDVESIISWTETAIEVAVPSFAGTGKIRVTTDGGSDTFISADDISIPSAESSARFDTDNDGNVDFLSRVNLVGINNEKGYVWAYNENFNNNIAATRAFEKSVEEWVCTTGINWTVALDASDLDITANDGVNLVRFVSASASNNDEIESGTLGVTTSYFSGCQNNFGQINSYLEGADMTFNVDVNWNFSEDSPSNVQVDFQGTVTHELGHAHNMGHVISLGQLMHFDTPIGLSSATRVVDEDTEIGARMNLDFSRSGVFCPGTNEITNKVCDSLSIRGFNYNRDFTIYQENDTLFVRSSIMITKLSIFDINGRVLMTEANKKELITSFLSSGVYILVIEFENGDLEYRKLSF